MSPATQHLAKEIVQSRRAVVRLHTNKAQLMSVGNALTEQLGTALPFPVMSLPDVLPLSVPPSETCCPCPLPHAAMIKVAGAMAKSTDVMKEVSKMMKIPQLQKDMVEMSKGESSP